MGGKLASIVPTDGLNSDIGKSMDYLGTFPEGLEPKHEILVKGLLVLSDRPIIVLGWC